MKEKIYLVTFTVQGKGTFPMDMLRHDCCWPADTHSAYALLTPEDRSNRANLRSVTLRRRVHANSPVLAAPRAVTVDRWASFGWTATFDGVDNVTPV